MALFNLREEILKEHSKAQCNTIVEWVGNDQQRFDQLFNLFLNDENIVMQRAGWPMSYSAIAHPELIQKNLGALIKNLQKHNLHNAIKRNSIRLLLDIDIPEKYQGSIMDICFNYVASPTEAIAVKAFSLHVLRKLAKIYPEILPEMKILIEEQLPHQTPAFKSSSKKILKMIN